MKILFITDLTSVGGTKTYLLNFVHTFEQLGYSMVLFCFSDDPQAKFFIRQLSRRVTQTVVYIKNLQGNIFSKRVFFLFSQLRQINYRQRFDCMLIDLPFSAFSIILLRPFLLRSEKKMKYIYQFHGLDALEKTFGHGGKGLRKYTSSFKKSIFLRMEVWILNHYPDQIFVFSVYAKNLLLKYGIYVPITVIYPGKEELIENLAKQKNKHDARNALGLRKDLQIVLICSRLEIRKGVTTFFKNLPDSRCPSDRLYILVSNFFNESETYTYFKAISKKQLALSIHHIQNPSRKEMALLYRAADLTIIPSIDLETFGFVTLESLTAGTPVIGYDIGANSELIDKEFLVSINQKKNIYAKIEEFFFLNSKQKQAVQTKIGQKITKYEWRTYVQQFIYNIHQNI